MTASKDKDPDTGLDAREDAALAKLYRHGAPGSPATLDEAVLARAEDALAATRRRRQQRLRIWSLAASVTLVTGLVWQLRDEVVPSAPQLAVAPAGTAKPEQPPEAGAAPAQNAGATSAAERDSRPEPRPEAAARLAAPATVQDTTRRKADATDSPAGGEARDTASVLAETAASKAGKRAAPASATGSIATLAAAQPPEKTLAASPISADAAAPAASAPEPRPLAAPDAEVQRLLKAIRALPDGTGFTAPGTRETLPPGAFADRLATATSSEALLRAAAGWQLTKTDGSTVAADRWLRELPLQP